MSHTTKEQLHQVVEALSDEEAADLLDYAEWLVEKPPMYSDEEIAQAQRRLAQMRRGDYLTLDEVRRTLGQ